MSFGHPFVAPGQCFFESSPPATFLRRADLRSRKQKGADQQTCRKCPEPQCTDRNDTDEVAKVLLRDLLRSNHHWCCPLRWPPVVNGGDAHPHMCSKEGLAGLEHKAAEHRRTGMRSVADCPDLRRAQTVSGGHRRWLSAPGLIRGFSAEKGGFLSDISALWRRERNWDRTFSMYICVVPRGTTQTDSGLSGDTVGLRRP
jgi:hypothetical protein